MESKMVVIITGAARGIGRAVAIKYAAAGYQLTLVDQDKEGLDETDLIIKKTYTIATLICVGDIADANFQQYIIQQTEIIFQRIDVLINNAAWRSIETMRTIDRAVWEKTIAICLTAPAYLAKYSAAVMERLQIPGVIINISSIMSERAAGYSPAYIAAKGGLESLTKELAITYGRSGIRVVSVNPGFIDTEMSGDYTNEDGIDINKKMAAYLLNATPLARSGKPEEIAEAIFWLSSNQAAFITGTSLLIDGGFKHNLNDYVLKQLQLPKDF
jgi:NAD(P)-dependent dehydrogenase (short-subunit alcohol dehydrogenase family)